MKLHLKIPSVNEMATILSRRRWVNSLWPSDAMWQHRSGSTLGQVMGWCLTVPSHYPTQCWLIISKVLQHSRKTNFTGSAQGIYSWNEFEKYTCKIISKSLSCQWVNTSTEGNRIIHVNFMPAKSANALAPSITWTNGHGNGCVGRMDPISMLTHWPLGDSK